MHPTLRSRMRKVFKVQLHKIMHTCYFRVFWVSSIQIGCSMRVVYLECMNINCHLCVNWMIDLIGSCSCKWLMFTVLSRIIYLHRYAHIYNIVVQFDIDISKLLNYYELWFIIHHDDTIMRKNISKKNFLTTTFKMIR